MWITVILDFVCTTWYTWIQYRVRHIHMTRNRFACRACGEKCLSASRTLHGTAETGSKQIWHTIHVLRVKRWRKSTCASAVYPRERERERRNERKKCNNMWFTYKVSIMCNGKSVEAQISSNRKAFHDTHSYLRARASARNDTKYATRKKIQQE